MATNMVTDSMRAHAEVLLERSDRWARGVRNSDGRAFVLFTSSRQGKDGRPVLYYTAPDGSACTCPSYYHRGACSHAEACRLDAEAAREKVARKRPSYSELFNEETLGLTSAF
jgi:hypothetical protein